MKFVAIGVHLQKDDVDSPAEAIPAGPLFISAIGVAADHPLSDRELILRVSSVRAALLDRATFIAIRYGFSFRTAVEAESKCAGRLEAWRRTLQENRTRVELALKTAAPGGKRPDRHDFRSGAEYLRALRGAAEAAAPPAEFRAAVDKVIVPLAVRHRWLQRDSASIELAGLIERNRLDDLAAAGEELRRAAAGVPFLLSAPWPLEVFADADHE